MISTCSMGNFFLETRGVNKVSCRRGDLDFTLQEGLTVPFPTPHAQVCLCECYPMQSIRRIPQQQVRLQYLFLRRSRKAGLSCFCAVLQSFSGGVQKVFGHVLRSQQLSAQRHLISFGGKNHHLSSAKCLNKTTWRNPFPVQKHFGKQHEVSFKAAAGNL